MEWTPAMSPIKVRNDLVQGVADYKNTQEVIEDLTKDCFELEQVDSLSRVLESHGQTLPELAVRVVIDQCMDNADLNRNTGSFLHTMAYAENSVELHKRSLILQKAKDDVQEEREANRKGLTVPSDLILTAPKTRFNDALAACVYAEHFVDKSGMRGDASSIELGQAHSAAMQITSDNFIPLLEDGGLKEKNDVEPPKSDDEKFDRAMLCHSATVNVNNYVKHCKKRRYAFYNDHIEENAGKQWLVTAIQATEDKRDIGNGDNDALDAACFVLKHIPMQNIEKVVYKALKDKPNFPAESKLLKPYSPLHNTL